uniref:Putative reverse transcriptase domain-containing protein n=1 Tax=Tanacetum cinerariifolium TaxID=118510 RepID=A0A6L2MWX9_TANCI|nr:putative reverse transcriptase domain-containing protein [Tanacetum cinerariifolium]
MTERETPTTIYTSLRRDSYRKIGSIINYEDLKAKFQSLFSQQQKFTKTYLAVHNIMQREGEITKAFVTSLVEFLSTYLPTTYKGLTEKTYTWIKAKEVATNGALNDHREGFDRTIVVEGKPFNTEHGLNKHKHMEPVKQKKRSLAPDRNEAICKEVEELMKADILQEVKYQTWVSNPVMVKKDNGKWKMCIDFIDVNKACPKDCYPLPEDNQKIESISKFGLKFFLDAYKGYHQIQMAKGDEEKTTFFTKKGGRICLNFIFLIPCSGGIRYFWSLESEGDYSVASIHKLIDEKRFQENVDYMDVSSYEEWRVWLVSIRIPNKLKSMMEGVFYGLW